MKQFFSKYDCGSIAFLAVFHGGFLILTGVYLGTQEWNWMAFSLSVILYIFAGIGITAGYHRYFSHRTYQAHTSIEIIYLLLGCMGFAGSAARWSYDHRIHHAKTDTDEDPYSIKKGFWYAHMGWFILRRPKMDPTKIPDLWSNKWVRLQHKYFILIAFSQHILLLCLGLLLFDIVTSVYFFSLFWMFFFHHSMFSINSLAHTWGSKTYARELTAVDNFLLAFLTFGEGYHNYHHAFPNDYRNGISWYHYDPTKWLIWILEKLHLTKNLRSKDGLVVRTSLMQKDLKMVIETLRLKLPDLHMREKMTERFEGVVIDFEKKVNDLHRKLHAYHELLRDKKDDAFIYLAKLECLSIQKELKISWDLWQEMIHHFDHQYVLVEH